MEGSGSNNKKVKLTPYKKSLLQDYLVDGKVNEKSQRKAMANAFIEDEMDDDDVKRMTDHITKTNRWRFPWKMLFSILVYLPSLILKAHELIKRS